MTAPGSIRLQIWDENPDDLGASFGPALGSLHTHKTLRAGGGKICSRAPPVEQTKERHSYDELKHHTWLRRGRRRRGCRWRGPSGKDRVDHVPGAHDDRANALAGVAHLLLSRAAGVTWDDVIQMMQMSPSTAH